MVQDIFTSLKAAEVNHNVFETIWIVKNKDEEIKKLKDKLAHFQRDPLNLEDKVVTDSDLEEYKKKVVHQEKALNIATSKITGLEYHIGKN